MILPSGVILNNDIFINTSHVVKMEKKNTDVIEVYMLGVASPVEFAFKSETDRDEAFNKIIKEMYSYNYAILNFDTK
jgi:hypothetical protein